MSDPLPGMRADIIIVSGEGSVDMTPDVVSFDVGVENEGKVIRTLVEEHKTIVARVLSALQQRGIKPEELKTSQFHLRSIERDDKPAGYSVSTQIGITRKGTADAGDWIAATIDAGANDVHGPEFSVENEKSAQDRCMDLAFADARHKASRLATLSERRIGKVLAVTDGSSSPFEFKSRVPGVEGGVLGGLMFQPGIHTVLCGVTVAFAMQD
jgi:uncharacterized protein YggE